MKISSILLVTCLVLNSCQNRDNDTPEAESTPITAAGVVYFKSDVSFDISYSNLISALKANENIAIVKELDHSQNAASVNMTLEPTKIVFFGNPMLGTPLMQKNQLAGLDLPQKVLIYQDENDVFALYNNTKYIASRYGVGDVESLPNIATALNTLVGTSVNAIAQETSVQEVNLNEGIVSVESTNDFETTYNALKSLIEANQNLSLVAELDHQQNAQSVNLELRPTKVIMFGNPNLGSPLMQSVRSIGLDLPQKMLVWEDAEGMVFVSYNAPDFLKKKHGLDGNTQELEQITNALATLAKTAAGVE